MAKILFAEDDEAMREMVAAIFASAGYTVRTADSGTAALAEIRSDRPDLVVLDYRLGKPDGFEICRRIKDDPRLQYLPVLILTAERDVENRILGFEAGANDYLAKPFDTRELLARVRALLRFSEQGRELNPTTGLPGGPSIEREFERRSAAGDRFTLCYLDLDFFKPFNDRFGFLAANGLIEALGAILRRATASSDHFAGHIGGDDFVVMCDPASARPLLQRVQREFAEDLGRVVPAEIVEKGAYWGILRNGTEGEVPLTRLSAALLHLDPEQIPPLNQLGELAAEGKRRAKESSEDRITEIEVSA